MKEIVINNNCGGFGLSDEAIRLYLTKKGIEFTKKPSRWDSTGIDFYINDDKFFSVRDIKRDDPILVELVKELNIASFGECATLKIIEIPDDVEWQIEEYDGSEWVAEKHRVWGIEL